jgi:hypothetical protein
MFADEFSVAGSVRVQTNPSFKVMGGFSIPQPNVHLRAGRFAGAARHYPDLHGSANHGSYRQQKGEQAQGTNCFIKNFLCNQILQ